MIRRLLAACLLAIGFTPNVALEGQVAAASVADEWAVSAQTPPPGIPFDGVQQRVIDPGAGRSSGPPALATIALAPISSAETQCEAAFHRAVLSACRPHAERLPYDANAPPPDSRARSIL